MRLMLVRHAESTGNAEMRLQGRADFPLSDTGRRQADALRRRLRAEVYQPTHVYSSPLRRTAETAAIAARGWPIPITHWDDLMEHDVGVLSGLTLEEAARKHPDLDLEAELARQFSGVEGAEPLEDRRRRAIRVVDTLLTRHGQGDSLFVVSHGGFIQHVVAVLMAAGRIWGFSTGNTALFDFSIDLDAWRAEETQLSAALFRIERFNDASHLEGLGI